MKEKVAKVLAVIWESKNDIRNIVPADHEFYFDFKNRTFSVRLKDGVPVFYTYPKWSRGPQELKSYFEQSGESEEAVFIGIGTSDVKEIGMPTLVRDLFDWLQEKHLGMDKLFEDFGVG